MSKAGCWMKSLEGLKMESVKKHRRRKKECWYKYNIVFSSLVVIHLDENRQETSRQKKQATTINKDIQAKTENVLAYAAWKSCWTVWKTHHYCLLCVPFFLFIGLFISLSSSLCLLILNVFVSVLLAVKMSFLWLFILYSLSPTMCIVSLGIHNIVIVDDKSCWRRKFPWPIITVTKPVGTMIVAATAVNGWLSQCQWRVWISFSSRCAAYSKANYGIEKIALMKKQTSSGTATKLRMKKKNDSNVFWISFEFAFN